MNNFKLPNGLSNLQMEIFDLMNIAVVFLKVKNNGEQFIIKNISKAALEAEKIKKEDVLNKNIIDIFPGIDKCGLLDLLEKVWQTGKTEYLPMSLYFDDRVIGMRENTIHKLSTGDIVVIYSTEKRDINKITNEKILRDFFDNANDAIFITEITENGLLGKFIKVNDTACKRLGYSRAELLKMSPWGIVADTRLSDEVVNNFQELSSKGNYTFKIMHLTKEGKQIPVEISARHIYLFGKKVSLAIARDLRNRKSNNNHFDSNTLCNSTLISKKCSKYTFNDIHYRSEIVKRIINKAKMFSTSSQPILLSGESGAGKDYFAQAIHNNSLQREGPFVFLNSINFSEEKIKLATKGTLYLDKIDSLSEEKQLQLLKILEKNKFYKNSCSVDTRIICSTNKNLYKMCQENQFDWDLFYQLALRLELPTLKERKEDINCIVNNQLELINNEKSLSKNISQEAMQALRQYSWPGNLRELNSVIETAYLLCQTNTIEVGLIKDILGINDFVDQQLFKHSKREKLHDILGSVDGNVTEAAKILNVSRTTIYRWIKELKEGQ